MKHPRLIRSHLWLESCHENAVRRAQARARLSDRFSAVLAPVAIVVLARAMWLLFCY